VAVPRAPHPPWTPQRSAGLNVGVGTPHQTPRKKTSLWPKKGGATRALHLTEWRVRPSRVGRQSTGLRAFSAGQHLTKERVDHVPAYLLAVALQQWTSSARMPWQPGGPPSPLGQRSGATAVGPSVYDYDDDQPDALSTAREDVQPLSRHPDTADRMRRWKRKMKTFLGRPYRPRAPDHAAVKGGHPRQLIVATAEALGRPLGHWRP